MSFKTGVLKIGVDFAIHTCVRPFPGEMVRKAPMLIVSRFSLQKNFRALIILVATTLSILFTPEAFSKNAQLTPVATSKTTTPRIEAEPSAWSLGLGFEYSENVAQQESGPKESGMELLLAPGLKINETFSLAIKASIIQASTEDKKPEVSTPQNNTMK